MSADRRQGHAWTRRMLALGAPLASLGCIASRGARAVLAAGLGSAGGGLGTAAHAATKPSFAAARPEAVLAFPRDHGAHPQFRTEWWYVTGWLQRADRPACGFQLTFFRSRTTHSDDNPSRFAPTQLLFAHAALVLPEQDRLVHAQRAARVGFGLATFALDDTDVRIDDWSLERAADDRYRGRASDAALALDLTLRARARPVLQGDAGYSRKGPRPEHASHYYSRPQLEVQGTIAIDGVRSAVSGSAWLDHEWSSTLLDASATGWDWIGINLGDGGSLMAFRIRTRGGEDLWSHVAWRDASGRLLNASHARPRFEPVRWWSSARSGARYPLQAIVTTTVDGRVRRVRLDPLIDDQEIDARASTGGYYWEGAVTAVDLDSATTIGRGYYELTGYAAPLGL